MYIVDVQLPEAGQWGVEFTTEAPGSPAETTRLTFEVHDDTPWVAVGEQGAGVEVADRGRCRGRPREDLDATSTPIRPSTRRPSPTRWPPTSRSS